MTTATITTRDTLDAALAALPRAASSAPITTGPPLLTGGANSQGDETTVGVDWLTMSGPGANLMKVLDLLEKWFGTTKSGKGMYTRDASFRWATGGIFYNSQRPEETFCVVQLPGSLLAEISQEETQVVIGELLDSGFHATRIDLAVDLRQHENLIPKMFEACTDGELVGSRTWQSIVNLTSGQLTALGCNIGRRGDHGSGRYLRVYDKGLETKTLEPGKWNRWEAELSSDCAGQAAEAIADSEDLAETISSFAFGVVDFLENNGKRRSRRPRTQWYADFIGSVRPVTLRNTRRKPTIESTARWISRCVAPAIQTIATTTGNTMGRVIAECCEIAPKADADQLLKPFVRAMCIHLGVEPTRLYESLAERRAVA